MCQCQNKGPGWETGRNIAPPAELRIRLGLLPAQLPVSPALQRAPVPLSQNGVPGLFVRENCEERRGTPRASGYIWAERTWRAVLDVRGSVGL